MAANYFNMYTEEINTQYLKKLFYRRFYNDIISIPNIVVIRGRYPHAFVSLSYTNVRHRT